MQPRLVQGPGAWRATGARWLPAWRHSLQLCLLQSGPASRSAPYPGRACRRASAAILGRQSNPRVVEARKSYSSSSRRQTSPTRRFWLARQRQPLPDGLLPGSPEAMSTFSRECRLRLTRGAPRSFECVSLGMPPQALLDQLVGDLQSHLEEMERLRVGLLDAYPRLSGWQSSGGGGSGGLGTRRSGSSSGLPRLEQSDDGRTYYFSLEVGDFCPEELAVKVDGTKLTVCGRRDQRSEASDGCICHEVREVRRELLLPDDADLEALTCCLAPEAGRLRIEAPRLGSSPAWERTVPIPICRSDGAAGSLQAGRSPSPGSPEKAVI
ncbi:heat shock protein beta-9 [Crotalus adamanteus]|uniref:Heat shock protein beta-9 n=1 Tax=Crotalus adamanteus TaxID=8729 RepID=A0AAW1BL39_CROAD